MPDKNLIPTVRVTGGEKFVNPCVVSAIKDGTKTSSGQSKRLPKPDWLRIRVRGGTTYEKINTIVH